MNVDVDADASSLQNTKAREKKKIPQKEKKKYARVDEGWQKYK